MELAEIYEKTADVIEERGLTHGRYMDEAGRVCLFGAAHVVLYGEPLPALQDPEFHHGPCLKFEHDLDRRLGESSLHWSDDHAAKGRPEVVVAKLREFAAEVRSGAPVG